MGITRFGTRIAAHTHQEQQHVQPSMWIFLQFSVRSDQWSALVGHLAQHRDRVMCSATLGECA